MFNRGTLVVVAIIAVGGAMAGFAWWFQRQQTYLALEFWGAEESAAIRAGHRVLLSKLTPRPRDADFQPKEVFPFPVDFVDTVDVTKAPGLVHMRQALLENVSFDFSPSPPRSDLPQGTFGAELRNCIAVAAPDDFQPTYMLVFMDEHNEVVVNAYFDFEANRVHFSQGQREAGLTKRLTSGLPKFFAEQFPEKKADE